MKLPALLLAACCAAAVYLPAYADVLPPQALDAATRLKDNPNAYDRVDNFCNGKKKGDACMLPGNLFEGGGEGTCVNEINRSTYVLEMSCQRPGSVYLDRKLPEEGFVHDEGLCRQQAQEQAAAGGASVPSRWNCKPLDPMPADRFCQGKAVGNACSVELRYQGKFSQADGTCQQVTEKQGFYYQGRRLMTRDVIRCEPLRTVTRTYTPATWWQKLTQ